MGLTNSVHLGDIISMNTSTSLYKRHRFPAEIIQYAVWRAVDQDGEVVDVFLQSCRDAAAAKCFFKRLLRNHGNEPRKIVTDKLKSYGVAHCELIPESIHDTSQYANNRAELSYQPARVRERGLRL